MIEKKYAAEIRELALHATEALSKILTTCQNRCSEEDYQRLSKGVGLAIGKIETDILAVVYASYPELDDLE